MVKVTVQGSFKKTNDFLISARSGVRIKEQLHKYAEEGLKRLRDATPVRTGYTAECWDYDIIEDGKTYSIVYKNSNVVNGQSIAILLQYGHATKSGGWVEGVNYINPALEPVFKKLASSAWKELTK